MWTEIDPNDVNMITYNGDLPSRLYRYRSVSPANLDRLINFEIIDEAIYLAGLKDLNDPDEGRFLMVFDGSDKEIFDYWKEAIKSTSSNLPATKLESEARSKTDQVIADGYVIPEHVINHTRHTLEHIVRVACFTTQSVNYSMWANYAKYNHPTEGQIDHAGICLEYQCNENWRSTNLHPVEYSDDLPILNLLKIKEIDLVKTVYKKTREWRGEEEWRMMHIIQAMPPFPENLTANSKIKIENSITSVIFGINTPKKVIKEIRIRVSEKNPGITYKKVVRNLLTYNRELIELK